MKHSVRSTLLYLGAGVVVQRLLQLLAFVAVGRALGVAGLGIYAEGMAVAAMLAVLASAGMRNLVAGAISQQTEPARGLVRHGVAIRLTIGLVLATIAIAIGFCCSVRPWFWLLCALHVVPAAFDLKNLVDAAGRTRNEVLLDAIAAADRPVGIKPSGGIGTAADAEGYLQLAESVMEVGWLSPATFRFGASGLLNALLAEMSDAPSDVVPDATAY